MSDWLKLAVTLLGFGILTWSSVQKLEYRVDKIETTLEQHLDKHEAQYDTIQKSLRDIEIQLTRLQK
jgi:Holliday junction resolvasome RuvABC endonuclease subunit